MKLLIRFAAAVLVVWPALTEAAEPPATSAGFRSAARSRDPLVDSVQKAIESSRRRILDTDKHSPWQIMHGLLGLRQGFQIRHDGKVASGIAWLSESGPEYEGESWFEITPHGGRAHPYTRPYAFEGHANQFLAILSMSSLPLEHGFRTAAEETITVGDMIENAKMQVSDKGELSWTLWALSRYVPSDAKWINAAGEAWSIERIVEIETAKPTRGAPCGGTHNVFALAHAVNVYLRNRSSLRGIWLEADQKVQRHIEIAKQFQNSDGMLSTNYFVSQEYDQEFSKRLASSGHVLEFLMLALDQKELHARWVRRAVNALARDLIRNRSMVAKCGPLYHTVDGLVVYLDRTQPRTLQPLLTQNIAMTRAIEAEGPPPFLPESDVGTSHASRPDAERQRTSDESQATPLDRETAVPDDLPTPIIEVDFPPPLETP